MKVIMGIELNDSTQHQIIKRIWELFPKGVDKDGFEVLLRALMAGGVWMRVDTSPKPQDYLWRPNGNVVLPVEIKNRNEN